MEPIKAQRAALVSCLLVTSIVFSATLLGAFVWDDVALLLGNPQELSWPSLWSALSEPFFRVGGQALEVGYYRPVIGLLYFVEQQLFGEEPIGYHLLRLLVHFGCLALAFAWLRERLATAERAPDSFAVTLASAFGALLFAVHPTKPEVVSWISGCTDMFMTLFVLASARAASRGRAVAAALFAVLAAFSKETGFVLPLLLAADAYWLDTGAARARKLRSALASAAALVPALAIRSAIVTTPLRATHAFWLDLPGRVAWSFGEYVLALVWPLHPTALRGDLAFRPDGAMIIPSALLWLGASCASIGVGVSIAAIWVPRLRAIAADLAWLVIPLLPVVNILRLGLDALVAERFLYLPSLGFAALGARALAALLAREGKAQRAAALGFAALVVLSLSILTASRVRAFEGNDAFWRAELARHPHGAFVLERLASLAIDEGQDERAVELAQAAHTAALRARLPHLEVRSLLFAALARLQSVSDIEQDALARLREFYDALGEGRAATLQLGKLQLRTRFDAGRVALLRDEVTYYWLPRGIAHARNLQLEQAIALFRRAQAIEPHNGLVRTQLALTLARAGRFDDALASTAVPQGSPTESAKLQGLRAMLARAREVSRLALPSAADAAQRDAQIFLMLGAPELARRALDPQLASAPDSPALIRMRAIVDAADRRPDLARARLASASLRMPAEAQLWSQAFAEIDALEQQARPGAARAPR